MKTNVERVLDYLWSAGPQGATNSQIRDATGIQPHQQVYLITQELKRKGGAASLDKLDKYLRAIWLECCVHLSKHPIHLMARNNPPEALCQECGQPAGWLCIQCLYEDDRTGYLCDACRGSSS